MAPIGLSGPARLEHRPQPEIPDADLCLIQDNYRGNLGTGQTGRRVAA